ncbi:ABC transporter permease [Caviibacter abscessus]|uniref:ABC transporter permease n=1 Tax=Caviibacter abscessus TaxID=1766719 RepID=UPI000833A36F|nr:ABC transporter permease [Caviibacter abscessus]
MNNFSNIKNKQSFLTGLKNGLWFEYKALIQNSSILYTNILFPIVYYIFFVKGLAKTIGVFNYKGRDLNYELYSLTGLIGIICVGEITNIIYRTVIDNKWGLLHLKLANGIGILSYSLSKSFYAIVGINVQIPILLIITKLTTNIGFINLLIGYIMSIIITLFWVNVGILIALKVQSYKTRDLITHLLLLPVYFSAPAYYILSDVDKYIKIVAHLNPLTYQLNGLREAMLFTNFSKDFIIVVLMTLIVFLINLLLIKQVKFSRSEM